MGMPQPAFPAFEKEGRRGFGRERIGAFPPSSRAPRVSLAPFPFPFKRLPRRLGMSKTRGCPYHCKSGVHIEDLGKRRGPRQTLKKFLKVLIHVRFDNCNQESMWLYYLEAFTKLESVLLRLSLSGFLLSIELSIV